MDRRQAIRYLSVALGYSITLPSILTITNSCKNEDTNLSILEFLNKDQGYLIKHLTDIILPKSEQLGAKDLNLLRFIDKILLKTASEKNQEFFKLGCSNFETVFTSRYKKKLKEGTKKEFEALLGHYFDIPKTKQKLIFQQLSLIHKKTSSAIAEELLIYKFLTDVRYLTLLGYYSSQEIAEGVLQKNVNLGYYEACIDL